MTPARKRISVLVADDHPLFRAALVDVVKRHPEFEFVAEAADGKVALEAIRRLTPDVTVLDLRMPGIDGAAVLNAVIRDDLQTRVLFVAASTDGGMVYDLLAKGAAGYVDKGASSEQIGDAIAAAARGTTYLTGAAEEAVMEQIRQRPGHVPTGLTPRELQILSMLADGLTAPAIAAQLFVEPSTVRTHIEHLYEKLEVSGRGAAVAEGMRRGLVE